MRPLSVVMPRPRFLVGPRPHFSGEQMFIPDGDIDVLARDMIKHIPATPRTRLPCGPVYSSLWGTSKRARSGCWSARRSRISWLTPAQTPGHVPSRSAGVRMISMRC
jgi:hypothetical protein